MPAWQRDIAVILTCMGLSFCLSPVSYAEEGQPTKEIIVADQGTEITFNERFRNPVISEPQGTGIRGLSLISVYDESWLVKDPMFPEIWLELESGEKIKHSRPGIQLALKKVDFVPKTEAEALLAARIYIDGTRYETKTILDNEGIASFMASNQPGTEKLPLAPPQVTRENLNYKVTFFVLTNPSRERIINRQAGISISRYEFLIGPDAYRLTGSETVWPEDRSLQPMPVPIAGASIAPVPLELILTDQLPPPHGPEPILAAVIRNRSGESQKVVADIWTQPVRLILTDRYGTEVPSEDQRAIASRVTGDMSNLVQVLMPGQDIFPARLEHRKVDGLYEAAWGTFKFRSIPPGVYLATLFWVSRMDSYTDKNGQAIAVPDIWLGSLESNPVRVEFR